MPNERIQSYQANIKKTKKNIDKLIKKYKELAEEDFDADIEDNLTEETDLEDPSNLKDEKHPSHTLGRKLINSEFYRQYNIKKKKNFNKNEIIKEIDQIKKNIIQSTHIADEKLYSENKKLYIARMLFLMCAGLTAIAESSELAYASHHIKKLFNIIQLSKAAQNALQVGVPLIYLVEAIGIIKKYTSKNIQTTLELIKFREIPEKHKNEWPPISHKKELMALSVYLPISLICAVVCSINAYFFTELLPDSYGFSVDHKGWKTVSLLFAMSSAANLFFTEIIEMAKTTRNFLSDENHNLSKKHFISKMMGILGGTVGVIKEIAESSAVVLMTLKQNSQAFKYGAIACTTIGSGIPNLVFKGGITGDACEAFIELFKDKSDYTHPKKIILLMETFFFSTILAEFSRNLYLNLMNESVLPFEVPKEMINMLGVLIGFRSFINNMYCSSEFFESINQIIANSATQFWQKCKNLYASLTTSSATAVNNEYKPLVNNESKTNKFGLFHHKSYGAIDSGVIKTTLVQMKPM